MGSNITANRKLLQEQRDEIKTTLDRAKGLKEDKKFSEALELLCGVIEKFTHLPLSRQLEYQLYKLNILLDELLKDLSNLDEHLLLRVKSIQLLESQKKIQFLNLTSDINCSVEFRRFFQDTAIVPCSNDESKIKIFKLAGANFNHDIYQDNVPTLLMRIQQEVQH